MIHPRTPPVQSPLKVLLVSAREDDRKFCERMAVASGMSLETIHSIQDIPVKLNDPGIVAVFMDLPPQDQFSAVEGFFVDARCNGGKISVNQIHLLTSEPLEAIDYAIRSELFSHYVLRQGEGADTEPGCTLYGRLLRAENSEQSELIRRILEPGAEIRSLPLKHSVEKGGVIEEVSRLLEENGFPPRVGARIANATDELLMNAIFDAPVNQEGEEIYRQTPRDAEIPLEGRQRVEVLIGFDGQHAAISVTDHFGSLRKENLTGKLTRDFSETAYQPSEASAGAGLGIFSTFSAGISLIYSSESGVKTEALIAFRKTENIREFKEQFHFFSLVTRKHR